MLSKNSLATHFYLIVLVATAVLLWPMQATAKQRLALLIGIDKYINLRVSDQLKTARNDAHVLGEMLSNLGFETTVEFDLTRSEFVNTLSQFAKKLNPGDEVVFFYAGHGVNFSGSNVFLPSDVPQATQASVAEETRIAEQSIREKYVVQTLRASGVKLVLLIIDACRNNPLNVDGDPSRGAIGLSQGLYTIPTELRGVTTLYSASTGQRALDRLPDEIADAELNSVFTRVLVKEIAKSSQNLRQIFLRTRKLVEEVALSVSHHEQTVTLYEGFVSDEFYFSGKKVSNIPISKTNSIDEWMLAKESGSQFVIEAFLNKYSSDPLLVALARTELAKLQNDNKSASIENDVGRECDRLASSHGNPDNSKEFQAVYYRWLDAEIAFDICGRAVSDYPQIERYKFHYARAANKLGNFDISIPLIDDLIADGYASAFGERGFNYFFGDGFEIDKEKAFEYYLRGANLGDGFSAGILAAENRKRGKYAKALEFASMGYQRADAGSTFVLGAMYREGQGVRPGQFEIARRYLSEAVGLGSESGHFSLAALQDEGKGGPADYRAAGMNLFKALEYRTDRNIVNVILNAQQSDDPWKSETVAELQLRLIDAGYLRGEADGILGPLTRQAILSYFNRP